jgi:hypothetical protein
MSFFNIMKKLGLSKIIFFVIKLMILGAISSCQGLNPMDESTISETGDSTGNDKNLPIEISIFREGEIRQWAVTAEASSEYANPEWSANQVVGPPNTEKCGDFQTAWASAGSDSIAWLEVRFPLAVNVTSVNIIQTFNPNQVRKVEVALAGGERIEIYNQPPQQIDQICPFTLSIPVYELEGFYDTVIVTVDQEELGLGWNQIDAVELLGIPQ